MRLVSLQAAHDKGESGLSPAIRRKLIDFLSGRGRVFISSEAPLSEELAPYRFPISPEDMHDALAFATLVISDSQTMTAEAAMLGTPSVRCNTFVGRVSTLDELEHRYQLTFGFHPESGEKMFSLTMELLDQPDLAEIWQRRRQRMLEEKTDLTPWMVDLVEQFASDAV
jgi:predicted glycosyltransferase